MARACGLRDAQGPAEGVAGEGYTRTAIGPHWTIALLIFAAFALGLYMRDLPLSPDKIRLYNYHKWIDLAVFLLAVGRVALPSHPARCCPGSNSPRIWRMVCSTC